MKTKLLKRTVAFMLASTLLFAFGCSKKTTDKNGANGNKYRLETLKLAGGQDWGGPNPFKRTQRGPASQKVNLVYDSLLNADVNGYRCWLAKEYKVDGNKYTFTLKDNAKWHDGKPVTAKDVDFTVKYYKEHPPVSTGLGAGEKYIVENTNVVNDKTIEITVKSPDSTTLSSLGTFHIIPQHIWENVSDPKTFNGEGQYVGCGMYTLKSYEPSTGTYEYEAFDNYYGGKQVTKKLMFLPVSNELLAFDNHEIDLTSVPMDVIDKYKKDSNIGFIETANSFGYRMHINFEKLPQFKDIEMRKAVYYAINRGRIVENVLRGAGAVGSAGYCPPTSAWYNPNVEKYDYNPEKAKAMFEGKNIALTLVCDDGTENVKIAELVKMDLEAAGIKVNVKAMDTQSRDAAAGKGDYDFIIISNGGWGLEPSQMRNILTVGSKGSGPGAGIRGWENENITALCKKIPKETDGEKQKEVYKQLQAETSKEVPLIILATSSSYSMFRKDYYDGWKLPFNSQQFTHDRINYIEK